MFVRVFSTCFFIGYTPFCPGTVCSLFSLLVYYYLLDVCGIGFLYSGTMLIFLFLLSWLVSNEHVKKSKDKDPSEIVVDEFVGQFLTIYIIDFLASIGTSIVFTNLTFLASKSVIYFSSFMLFRIFDIVKPGIIGLVDRKLAGGIGVMLDDVVSSFFASFFGYIIFLCTSFASSLIT